MTITSRNKIKSLVQNLVKEEVSNRLNEIDFKKALGKIGINTKEHDATAPILLDLNYVPPSKFSKGKWVLVQKQDDKTWKYDYQKRDEVIRHIKDIGELYGKEGVEVHLSEQLANMLNLKRKS